MFTARRYLLPFVLGLTVPAVAFASNKDGSQSAQSSVPPVFDCAKLSWMHNCKAVNQAAAAHPNMPLRVYNKNGLEFNFPPGTPTAAIRLMVLQTPQAADAYLNYVNAMSLNAQHTAELVKAALARRGGRLSLTPSNSQLLGLDSDHVGKNVHLFLFYKPGNKKSLYEIGIVSTLATLHPNVKISYIQMGGGKATLQSVNDKYGIKAFIPSASQVQAFSKKIKSYPSLWYQNSATKTEYIQEGLAPYTQVIANLKMVSTGE